MSMTEQRFWELVDAINWGSISELYIDSNCIKRDLIKQYGDEAYQMRGRFNQLYNTLDSVVSPELAQYQLVFDQYLVGDDSYSDLIAHIIGLGRDEYYSTLNNPQLAIIRAKDGRFSESFSYVLPYVDNQSDMPNPLDYNTYVNWANRIITQDLSTVDWNEIPSKDLEQVRAAYDKFNQICQLVIAKQPLDAVSVGNDVHSTIKSLSALRCATAANIIRHASLPNLVMDINCWILGNNNKAGYS